MNRKILGLLSAGLLAAFGMSSANAALISGTWNFTTASGYNGSFSFTDLDTSATYNGSTAAGFSVSTNFDTSGSGGNVFWYPYANTNYLLIGGRNDDLAVSIGSTDWFVAISSFATQPTFFSFLYGANGYVAGADEGSLSVPEPGTLALLGLGLVGLGLSRRRKAA